MSKQKELAMKKLFGDAVFNTGEKPLGSQVLATEQRVEILEQELTCVKTVLEYTKRRLKTVGDENQHLKVTNDLAKEFMEGRVSQITLQRMFSNAGILYESLCKSNRDVTELLRKNIDLETRLKFNKRQSTPCQLVDAEGNPAC